MIRSVRMVANAEPNPNVVVVFPTPPLMDSTAIR
ncbi:Uncharacterised protein [Mycobacteroides abscessus subsp. abscessus]|nr:Uncharacterised protein [Mycobacteroides abscessus subsp. abscessus]